MRKACGCPGSSQWYEHQTRSETVLQRLQALIVDDADDSRRSDGYIQASQSRIVHHDVRLSRQRDAPEHRSRVAMQGDQRFAIGRAEETLAGDNQAMRASNWNVESSA